VPVAEWESDLRNMQALGFSFISVFTPWQRFEEEKGRFDFSELARVLDIAGQVGLRASIAIGVHRSFSLYPPRWLMEEYQGAGMLDKDGKPTVSGTHRLPCFEDPWYRDYAEKYLTALVRQFAGHEALAQWRVWGEASLFDLCYCPIHAEKFRAWLRVKYGSQAALNSAWNSEGPSGFTRWEQIFPPRDAYHFYGYTSWLDWQEFLDSSLTANVQWVNDIVKREDPRHDTLVELWMPGSNSSGGGDDVWRMAGAADLLGLSIYNKPVKDYAFDMDMMRSAAECIGRQAWAIEIQGAPRLFGWGHPSSPPAEQMTLWLWQLIGHGAKGGFYWTYRARTSDIEGGEFGMVRRDGSVPERTRRMGEEFQVIQQHADLLLQGRRLADTAIFWSREAEHLAKIDNVDGREISGYVHSVHSCHELLWRAGIPADFIDRSRLTVENLARYRVLLLPFAFCLDREAAKVITAYVRQGGTVIADFLCGSKDSRGNCDTVAPGFGLAELFGVAEDEFYAAAGEAIRTPDGPVAAFEFLQTLRLRGAEAFGFLPSGLPVFARHRCGEGEAILLGTMAFHREAWLTRPANRAFLLGLLRHAGVSAPVEFTGSTPFEGEAPETALLAQPDGSQVLLLLNHSGAAVSGTLRVRTPHRRVRDLRAGADITAREKDACLEFPVDGLPSLGVNLYRLDSL